MNNEIFIKIMNYRNGDNDCLLDIIEIFNPLISKYSKLLEGEDTKQDLIIYLINITNKIPVDNNSFFDNRAIFSYIAKSIRNEYIKLSKKKDKKTINEIELNVDIEIGYEDFESEIELLDLFKILTEREAYIIKLIYIYYLSVNEIADFMKISRQAVNQAKNRALRKIKDVYLT